MSRTYFHFFLGRRWRGGSYLMFTVNIGPGFYQRLRAEGPSCSKNWDWLMIIPDEIRDPLSSERHPSSSTASHFWCQQRERFVSRVTDWSTVQLQWLNLSLWCETANVWVWRICCGFVSVSHLLVSLRILNCCISTVTRWQGCNPDRRFSLRETWTIWIVWSAEVRKHFLHQWEPVTAEWDNVSTNRGSRQGNSWWTSCLSSVFTYLIYLISLQCFLPQ